MNAESGAAEITRPCAVCRYKQKVCDSNCEMAEHFPASKYNEFQIAKDLFSMHSIEKIIESVPQEKRQATANAILMHGQTRVKDPVDGCLGNVLDLESQIQFYRNERKATDQNLAFFHKRDAEEDLINLQGSSSSSSVKPPATEHTSQF